METFPGIMQTFPYLAPAFLKVKKWLANLGNTFGTVIGGV